MRRCYYKPLQTTLWFVAHPFSLSLAEIGRHQALRAREANLGLGDEIFTQNTTPVVEGIHQILVFGGITPAHNALRYS